MCELDPLRIRAPVAIVSRWGRVRNQFPLHYIVFKQTASHIPHEGNSEQLFSRSGALSDDNGKMDPWRLAVWTSVGVNMATYMPGCKQILERYMLKFAKAAQRCTKTISACATLMELTKWKMVATMLCTLPSQWRVAHDVHGLQDGQSREAGQRLRSDVRGRLGGNRAVGRYSERHL